MTENDLSKIIVDKCYKVHTTLGPGLFESVYEEVMMYELAKSGLSVARQPEVPVIYENQPMGIGFRADMIVEKKVIIEIKSIVSLQPVHQKQLQTYLRLTGLKLGLLVNFNEALIKNGIKRIVNKL